MANTACWYQTQLPDIVIQSILEEAKTVDDSTFTDSRVNIKGEGTLDSDIRKGKNCWIDTTHWIGGFIWHYVMRTNRENFLYDISHIQYNNIQFSRYEEGDFYTWHLDQDVKSMISSDQEVRKLSFSLQLSKDEDYVGGNLEFTDVDNETFIAPRDRGCLIIFDSRTIHRVSPVESGVRESLVGWVVGPRWK